MSLLNINKIVAGLTLLSKVYPYFNDKVIAIDVWISTESKDIKIHVHDEDFHHMFSDTYEVIMHDNYTERHSVICFSGDECPIEIFCLHHINK